VITVASVDSWFLNEQKETNNETRVLTFSAAGIGIALAAFANEGGWPQWGIARNTRARFPLAGMVTKNNP
jgi:hypothetical protein